MKKKSKKKQGTLGVISEAKLIAFWILEYLQKTDGYDINDLWYCIEDVKKDPRAIFNRLKNETTFVDKYLPPEESNKKDTIDLIVGAARKVVKLSKTKQFQAFADFILDG